MPKVITRFCPTLRQAETVTREYKRALKVLPGTRVSGKYDQGSKRLIVTIHRKLK